MNLSGMADILSRSRLLQSRTRQIAMHTTHPKAKSTRTTSTAIFPPDQWNGLSEGVAVAVADADEDLVEEAEWVEEDGEGLAFEVAEAEAGFELVIGAAKLESD